MTIRFIAEIGSNHNQSWDRTAYLIKKAKEIGCWGVKFQLFKAEKLYAPEFKKEINTARERELPEEWIPRISELCGEVGIKFGCTPFHPEAVDLLVPLAPYVDWLKISSFDVRREGLIKKCMLQDIPLMVSLGLARGRDIIQLYKWAKEMDHAKPITLLHCVPDYPTKLEDCYMEEGMGQIMRLAGTGMIDLPVLGWSDHTVQPAAIFAAIRHGAQVIECHFDDVILNVKDGMYESGLENRYGQSPLEGPGSHCWTPTGLSHVIKRTNEIEIASAEGTGPWEAIDQDNYKWLADPEDGLRPLREYRKELP